MDALVAPFLAPLPRFDVYELTAGAAVNVNGIGVFIFVPFVTSGATSGTLEPGFDEPRHNFLAVFIVPIRFVGLGNSA